MLPEIFTPRFLRQIEQLRVRSRRAFLGSRQGGHASIRRGHGIEFADYRKYEQGDDPRRIDWNVYARSDRMYVRRFREEEDLTVLIIVDTSASMTVPENDRKWEIARDLAIAISYVALMSQDTVVVSALGHIHTPKLSGARALQVVSSELQKLEPGKPFEFQREIRLAASRVRFPGKAVLISDFLMPIADIRAGLGALRAKNLEISAIQVLGEHDVRPFNEGAHVLAMDSESGEEVELLMDAESKEEYDDLLANHNKELEQACFEGEISFTQKMPQQPFDKFVLGNLTKIGLLR